MMGGMMGGGMGVGMIFVWIFWLLILAAIVYVVVRLLRQSGAQPQSAETPLTILKRRYAAGEIDQTQYETLKSQLS
jgi:putative membrane protein